MSNADAEKTLVLRKFTCVRVRVELCETFWWKPQFEAFSKYFSKVVS